MAHQLTIEGDEACALARELAALTGETIEEAVTQALQLRLTKEQGRLEYLAQAEKALEAFRATLTELPASSDHSFLYDDNTGLPI